VCVVNCLFDYNDQDYSSLDVDSLDSVFDTLGDDASPQSSANQHTLFAKKKSTSVSSSSSVGILVSSTSQREWERAGVGAVLKLLWGLFLQSYARGTNLPGAGRFTMWIGQRHEKYISLSRKAGALEYFVALSSEVLHKPRYARELPDERQTLFLNTDTGLPFGEASQSGSDSLVYCLISQEAVNTLVNAMCFGAEVADMDLLSTLVELNYRGNEYLCSCFWDRWNAIEQISDPSRDSSIPEQNYPLCRLVKLLLETTPHAPMYMCKIINSLICSIPSAIQGIVLLSQPVNLVSEVPLSDVSVGVGRYYDGRVEWLDASTWLQEHSRGILNKSLPVKYCVDGAGDGFQGPMKDMLSPPAECMGKSMAVMKDTQSMLVRWQCETKWLAIVMDALQQATREMSSSTDYSHMREKQDFYCDSVSLLASITLYLSSEAISILTDQWDQICLVSYLRKIGGLEIYSALYEAGVTPIDLKRNQQSVYDHLTTHGVEHNHAVAVLERASELYCPPFADLYMELSVDLMCALTLHPCRPSSSNGHLSVEHQSWRHLLASSIYLLRCIVSSSASSEYALTLMKAMTQKFDVKGPNNWSSVLFRITSLSEGTIGVYEVTEQVCQLLGLLLNKIQTPVPPDSNGLYNLFCNFDSDGNGTISREELQEGLRHMGYEVSISAVDALFQHIDVNISSSIHFSQLLQYAAANASLTPDASQSSPGYNASYVFASDADKAEQGLKLLLQDLISPGGHSSSVIAELLACSVVEYCLNCISSMDRWRFSTSSHRWVLNLNCLNMLLGVMQSAAPDAPMVLRASAITKACEVILERFVGDMQFQSALVQQGLMLGLTALQSTFAGTGRESSRTLKSFISQPTSILSADSSSGLQPTILPANFSLGYYGYSSSTGSLDLELVEKIAVQTLSLFEQLLDFSRHYDNPEGIVLQSFNQLVDVMYSPAANIGAANSSASASVNPLISARNTSAISSSSLPCLNLAVLCALVDYPRSPCSPSLHPSSHIPQATVNLLTKLVSTYGGRNQTRKHSFVDGIGAQNMVPLCQSLCAWLLSKTDPYLKYSILDFLVALCIHEPLALVLLLNVPSDTPDKKKEEGPKKSGLLQFSQSMPDKSLLVNAIEKLLRRADFLYDNHPVVLHKLLELVLTLVDKSDHLSIGNVVLHLCKSKTFWDDVTVPLMLDLQPPPELAPTSPSIALNAHNVTATTASSVRVVPNEYTHAVVKYCIQLRVHATALRILARERFGSLFFVDESVFMMAENKVVDASTNRHSIAEKVEKIVDNFFEKANGSHRFLSWVNHYMRVDIDHVLQKSTEKCARTVGLNLSSLVNIPVPSRMGLPPYGASYLYHFRLTKCMSATAHEIADKINRAAMQPRGRASGYSEILGEWGDLVGRVVRLNCMWSVADSQVTLLRGWREFIEVYVQPSPNRPSTYNQGSKSSKDKGNGSAQRSELRSDSKDFWDSSDDDIPGTPPSFSHSQSQSTGERCCDFDADLSIFTQFLAFEAQVSIEIILC
jgi:hypothetical protein